MKTLIATLLAGVIGLTQVQAQSESDFSVKYMVTYEAASKSYTAWVVPEYSLPNVNNGDTEEKGSTAQLTLKVPREFTLTGVKDLRGVWEKQPLKIGGQAAFLKAGADAAFEYYIIGKTPSETNYGTFTQGEPVALFTFTGRGGNTEAVSVLENNDPFVRLADRELALNVGSSFYSRSGQAAKMQAKPLEQFRAKTSMTTVLAEMTKKLAGAALDAVTGEPGGDIAVVAYPNPVVETLTVKYFSQQDGTAVRMQLADMQGTVKQTSQQTVKRGFNTFQLNMATAVGGTYLLQTVVGDKVVTKKIMKQL